jgi:hypothetical protein
MGQTESTLSIDLTRCSDDLTPIEPRKSLSKLETREIPELPTEIWCHILRYLHHPTDLCNYIEARPNHLPLLQDVVTDIEVDLTRPPSAVFACDAIVLSKLRRCEPPIIIDRPHELEQIASHPSLEHFRLLLTSLFSRLDYEFTKHIQVSQLDYEYIKHIQQFVETWLNNHSVVTHRCWEICHPVYVDTSDLSSASIIGYNRGAVYLSPHYLHFREYYQILRRLHDSGALTRVVIPRCLFPLIRIHNRQGDLSFIEVIELLPQVTTLELGEIIDSTMEIDMYLDLLTSCPHIIRLSLEETLIGDSRRHKVYLNYANTLAHSINRSIALGRISNKSVHLTLPLFIETAEKIPRLFPKIQSIGLFDSSDPSLNSRLQNLLESEPDLHVVLYTSQPNCYDDLIMVYGSRLSRRPA